MAQAKPVAKHRRRSGNPKEGELRPSDSEAREQFARSEERWRSVFENSVIGAALTDPNGKFIAANPAYQAMLGYTEKELQHLRFLDVTVEEFRDRDRVLAEELLAGKRQQFQSEKQYRRKDGTFVWVRDSVSLVPGTEGMPRFIMALSEDVTERKQSEAALQASQIKLRQVIDAIPTQAWSAWPDGSAEFFNQRWLDYAGLTSQQAEGWGWKATIHADDLDRMVNYWQTAISTGEPVEIEGRLRRFDGAYRWFLIRAEPFRDETGKIRRWYGTSIDIEDRKRGEEQLRRSEEFLAEGQRLSRTGTFWWRLATGEIRWSEELFHIFGFDPTATVTLELIGSRVHPDDLPMLEDMISRAHQGDTEFEYEHRIVMPDGAIKYIHLFGHTVFDVEGRLEYIGAAQEVSQRRVAEEQLRERELDLRRITQTIPGMLWSASLDGRVDYCNRPWLDFTAMTLEQAKEWGWTTAIYPDDRDTLIDHWRASLTSGTPLDVEARIRRFDGSYRWFLFRANPLRDESGRIVKWYGTNLDIENRKQGEEVLRARELSWRQIVDNIPGLVHTTSASGEVEFLNRQVLEYFGKTSQELKDWSRLGIVHPDDLPHVIEAWRKSVETGQPYEVEQRNRGADGAYRWFQSRGRAVRSPEGEITAWYWLNTDIEDRKKAEEALLANERNLSLIINTMPTLVWSARPDGSAEFLNQHYLDYVGLPLGKLQGWGWTAAVHPEDLKALLGVWQSILATSEPGEAEARLRRFDGEYRWFLFRTNPMRDESGRTIKWYGTNTDIHDRKRAEAEVRESYLRLAEAQQLSKTGSFITDLVADQHDWSEETFRIFEFDPVTKVTVQMIQERIHPEDRPSFDSMIGRAMTGKDVDFSFRFVTSRGAVKHIRGMARVIEHVVGRPLFIGALQDVTESKLAEEALSRARSDLAHVARVTTLNALTASIAHEINQPLSGIITNANTGLWLLSTDPPDVEGAREAAERTIRDGNRASDVIKRLRTLYSRKEFRPEAMNLNEAAREIIALSLSDLRRNRIIVHEELADDLPAITGDRIQIQQVLLNLVRNASDAMSSIDDRARDLLIKTKREKDNWVRLTVTDSGVGFQPQTADKLFEAFYSTKADGMGIGLYLSRSIVEAHHGRMWASVNDGPGSTFSIALPCKPEVSTGSESRVDLIHNPTAQY